MDERKNVHILYLILRTSNFKLLDFSLFEMVVLIKMHHYICELGHLAWK